MNLNGEKKVKIILRYWERIDEGEKKTKIDLLWVYEFNTSTSFEPLSVTFSSIFSCLSAKPDIVCETVCVCMWNDTNAMFIFVSERCFFLRRAAGERYGIHIRMFVNTTKHNRSEVGDESTDSCEKNINVWFLLAVTTSFWFFQHLFRFF